MSETELGMMSKEEAKNITKNGAWYFAGDVPVCRVANTDMYVCCIKNGHPMSSKDIEEAGYASYEDAFGEGIYYSLEKADNVKAEAAKMLDVYGIDSANMRLLTTNGGTRGASILALPGVLMDLAYDIKADGFYIVPTSINEVIALPGEKTEEANAAIKTVLDINNSRGSQTVLTDSVYYYDALTDKLEFAA